VVGIPAHLEARTHFDTIESHFLVTCAKKEKNIGVVAPGTGLTVRDVLMRGSNWI